MAESRMLGNTVMAATGAGRGVERDRTLLPLAEVDRQQVIGLPLHGAFLVSKAASGQEAAPVRWPPPKSVSEEPPPAMHPAIGPLKRATDM